MVDIGIFGALGCKGFIGFARESGSLREHISGLGFGLNISESRRYLEQLSRLALFWPSFDFHSIVESERPVPLSSYNIDKTQS